MELVSRILGRAPLYRYADPLGAMNLAVMHEGDALGWHFDQTDFVVSLAIQPSDGVASSRTCSASAGSKAVASTSATTPSAACWRAMRRSS